MQGSDTDPDSDNTANIQSDRTRVASCSDRHLQAVIVTGASSGIGQAMSEQLLEEGYSVYGLARDFKNSTLRHDRFHRWVIDLDKTDAILPELRNWLKSISMPVRALINNAGLGRMGYLEQLSAADIKLVMNVNFLAHVLVTKAVLPMMKQQQQLADIVFTGSEAALAGSRQGSIYCASKFALRGFAQSLREECANSKLRVSLVNPGAVRTGFFDELHFEPGEDPANAILPGDIAKLVLGVLNLPGTTVVDEINLSPLKQAWRHKSAR